MFPPLPLFRILFRLIGSALLIEIALNLYFFQSYTFTFLMFCDIISKEIEKRCYHVFV